MDRPRKKINFVSTTGLLLLTILFSCGPRTGIDNDNEQTDSVTQADNEKTSEKVIDVWYNEADGKLFKQNCAVCHSLTDQIIDGPGLAGVKDRIPQPSVDWFVKYTLNNEKVFKSGDPYAAKLKDEYKGHPMTVFEGVLTEQEVKRIYKVVTFSTTHTVP